MDGEVPGTSARTYAIIAVALLVALAAIVAVSLNGASNGMEGVGGKVGSSSAMLLKNQESPAQDAADGAGQQAKNPEGVDLSGRTPKGNGDLVIVEYSDFQCPFCTRAVPIVEQIIGEYGDNVRVYYKHFPLSQIHQYAQKAAEASECAADQGMFWEYHDKLFENQASLDTPSLKRYAGQMGLDQNEFDACLDSGKKASLVKKDLQEGLKLGVTGTPTFLINEKKVVGAQPFEAFKQVIDAEIS